MKLSELEPTFIKRTDAGWYDVTTLAEADGICFLCPKCFEAHHGRRGTHAIVCWRPHVPQTVSPKPGRWDFKGTGIADLTLVAESSSVLLSSSMTPEEEARLPAAQRPCRAHFFVTNGEIIPC